MRAHLAPSTCPRTLALRLTRTPYHCCALPITAPTRPGFGGRASATTRTTPARQHQRRTFTSSKTQSRLTPLSRHADTNLGFLQQYGGPEAGSIVAGRRKSSGFLETLFGRRSKKYAQRPEKGSSRYLDSGPEDAILGRSLLHKNNGDEFLRCTEFDREGLFFPCFRPSIFMHYLSLVPAGFLTGCRKRYCCVWRVQEDGAVY